MFQSTTFPTPYYAVIFSSVRSTNEEGYKEMAERMVELAKSQPGFLGIESASEDLSITVSYWETLEDIKQWKSNADHLEAQQKGKKDWYKSYTTRIAKVERDYGFTAD